MANTKIANGLMDAEVKWNFHKYLLDEHVKLAANYPSSTTPTDAIIG